MTWHEGLNCYVASLPDGSQKPVRYEPVFDWRPGEEVKLDLTADRIAELLNIVEAGLPPWIGYRDLERVMFGYRLDAGHGLGATCWHCGEPCPDEAPRYGIGSFGHEWLTWSVRTHHYCRPAETKWPAVPPEEALTPNIRAWLARRDGLLRIRSDG